jgi:hypothetical protein
MATLEQLRSLYDPGMSDAEVIGKVAEESGMPASDIAMRVGYDMGGKWGNATAAALDTAKSQLYDTGEAVARGLNLPKVADAAKERRVRAEKQADAESRFAQEQGLVTDWRDIKSAGDVGNVIGSTAIQSAPQMVAQTGAATAGAWIGGGLGTLVEPGLGTVAGAALGAKAGQFLGGLPFYFGSNRQAQREQSAKLPGGERTDDTSALVAAAGQAGLDALVNAPVEKMVGSLGQRVGLRLAGGEAEKAASKAKGSMFSPTKIGKDFALGGAEEALGNEVPQQVLEEYARKQVDPDHDMLGGEAMGRYADSTVGAFALGGPMNVVHGMHSRAKATLGDDATSDAPVVPPGHTEYTQPNPDDLHGPAPGLVGPPKPDFVGPVQPDMPLHGPSPDPGPMPQETLPAGAVKKAVTDAMPVPDAEAPLTDEERRQKAIDTAADQYAKDHLEREQRGLDRGVAPAGIDAYHELEAAHKQNLITDEEFAQNLGLLKIGNKTALKTVNKFLTDTDKAHQESQAKAKLADAGIAEPTGTETAPAAPAAPTTTPTTAAAPATPKTTKKAAAAPVAAAPAAPDLHGPAPELVGPAKPEAAPAPPPPAKPAAKEGPLQGPPRELVGPVKPKAAAAPAPVAAPAPAVQPELVGPKPELVGPVKPTEPVYEAPKKPAKTVREAIDAYVKARVANTKPMTESERQRIHLAAGLDKEGNWVQNPLTYQQVAEAEHARAKEGKRASAVKDTTIQATLKKYGFTREALDTLNKLAGARLGHEATGAQVDAKTGNMRADATEERSRTPQMADETDKADENVKAEASEGAAKFAEGFSDTGTANESKMREDLTVRERIRKSVRMLAEATTQQTGLNDKQREAFGKLQESVKEKAGEDTVAATERAKDAVDTLLSDEELFPDKEQNKWLEGMFATGKGEAAKVRNEAAVKAVGEIDEGPSKEAQERKQIMDVLNGGSDEDIAKLRESLPPALQAKMDEFLNAHKAIGEDTDEPTLEQLLPTDMHNDIADAQDSWNEFKVDNDPAWEDLTPHEQASWVKATVARYGTPKMGEIQLSEQLYERRQGELSQAAQERAAKENPRGKQVSDEHAGERSGRAGAEVSEAGRGGEAAATERGEPATSAASRDAERLGEAAKDDAQGERVQRGEGRESTADTGAAEGRSGDVEEQQLQNIDRTDQARATTDAPLTVEPPAATQHADGAPRSPSVIRELRKLTTQLEAGTLTPVQFAERASLLLAQKDEHTLSSPVRGRVRDVDHIRAALLEARRRGDLHPDAVEFADWLLRNNPQWANQLGISIRQRGKGERGVSGFYNSLNRIVTLLKGSNNTETAVHEILHHIERMMPPAMQNTLRKAWMYSTAMARQEAFKSGNKDVQAYYRALLNYHFGNGNPAHLKEAEKLLKDGKVGYEHYAHFNPSEFWAVNGSRIMQARFGVSESMAGRIKQWVREFIEHAKNLIGMKNDSAVIKALNAMTHADGTFQSGVQLMDQKGVHFMYAGLKSAQQEKVARQARAEEMDRNGTDADYIRKETGWFKGLDGRWRYEIGDQDAHMIDDFKTMKQSPMGSKPEDTVIYKLGDVLDHPELFAAYPAARDIEFVKQAVFGGGYEGMYDGKNRITIVPTNSDPLSTTLHEVQHWIQVQQGWAKGGNTRDVVADMNPNQYERFRAKLTAELTTDLDRAKVGLKKMGAVLGWAKHGEYIAATEAKDKTLSALSQYESVHGSDWGLKKPEHKALADAYREARDKHDALDKEAHALAGNDKSDLLGSFDLNRMLDQKTRAKAEDFVQGKINEYTKLEKRIADIQTAEPEQMKTLAARTNTVFAAYNALAGEMEARDVQARKNMDPAERAANVPFSSKGVGDIAKEDVIRVMNGPQWGAAMEASPMLNVERPVSERTSAFDDALKRTTDHLPPRQGRWARETALSVKGGVKTMVKMLSNTEDIIRQAIKAIPSGKDYVNAARRTDVAKRARIQALSAQRDGFSNLSKGERAAINSFLKESTLSDKWGYQPTHLAAPVTVDPAMRAKFNALPTAAAKKAVMDVFAHNHGDLMAMKASVSQQIASRYDATIAQARAAGDPRAVRSAEQAKASALKEYARLMSINEFAPYAPLKRFGDFVVVGKSQAYIDAENAGDKSAMLKMQSDPSHYYFGMRETRGEAVVHAEEIAGQYANVDNFAKTNEYSSFGTASMMAGFSRMQNMMAKSENLTASAQSEASLHRLMTDLYYSLLSEGSARQSERMRVGVAGADEDMLRSHLTKGQANAHFISMLENSGVAQDALEKMREEANRTGVHGGMAREERMDHFNEVLKRHAMSMDFRPTPKPVQYATQISTYWQLLTSPASWFVNLTQPLAVSAPVIAARHGMYSTTRELAKAYREMTIPLTMAAKNGRIDDAKLLSLMPADVRANVEELIKIGRVSSDTNYDLDNWRSATERNTFTRINDKVKGVMGNAEMMNRVVTAIAAVRLENAKDNHAGATDYASKIIYDTHGDYSGFNAPSPLRTPAGKLIGQYRKFQLNQLGMYGRLIHDAFKGEDSDTRWVAQKALMYSFGSMGVWAGALGMPAMKTVAYVLAAAFGDPDEPTDPELTMRKIIGNDDLATLLLKGVPAALGVDLSSRVGAGDMLNPLPFGKMGLDRKSTTANIVSALGPWTGVVTGVTDGISKMMKGDIVGGTAEALPRGASNVIKAFDLMSRGVRQPNGDVALSPDEFSVLDGVMQGLGLPTAKTTERSAAVGAKYEMDQLYREKAGALKKAYTEAYKDGSGDKLGDVRQEWNDMQAHRKANGYKPAPLSELLKAPMEQRKRERMTAGGIQFRRKDAGVVRQLEDIY